MSTLTPPVAGDTKRAFLVRNGLAKEGARGRFGKDAIAALAEFPDFVFTEVVPTSKPKTGVSLEKKPAAPKVDGATRAAEALARREAKQAAKAAKADKPKISQVRADAPSPLLMPKRKQKEGWVIDPSIGKGTLIAITTCARADKGGCGKAVNYCACPKGPLAPHYLPESVALKPLLLDKPVV